MNRVGPVPCSSCASGRAGRLRWAIRACPSVPAVSSGWERYGAERAGDPLGVCKTMEGVKLDGPGPASWCRGRHVAFRPAAFGIRPGSEFAGERRGLDAASLAISRGGWILWSRPEEHARRVRGRDSRSGGNCAAPMMPPTLKKGRRHARGERATFRRLIPVEDSMSRSGPHGCD